MASFSRFSDPSSHLLSRRQALRAAGFALGAAALSAGGVSRLLAAEPKSQPAAASEPPPIASSPLGGKLTLITGAGGNILVLAGTDGGLVVDSGLAGSSVGLVGEIGKAAPGPLALLVNTHWHFDHAGGNERLAGAGARIVAHENCRKRLASDQTNEFLDMKFSPSPRAALPVVTFTSETALHLNDEEIRLIPVAPAHTDGDVLVRLEKANVLHMGDVHFNGLYPFIDYSSGGWIGGMAAAAKAGLALTDAKTRIIPGHGPLATQEDLKGYIAFLDTMLDRLSKAKAAGKTVDEVAASAPSQEFDEKLGKGFLSPERFVRCAYQSLLRHG